MRELCGRCGGLDCQCATTPEADKALEEKAKLIVDKIAWRDRFPFGYYEILLELREVAEEAKREEFERLYQKVVNRISADIDGDFDAGLDQLEYNACRKEAAEWEKCTKMVSDDETCFDGTQSLAHVVGRKGACLKILRLRGVKP